MAHILPDQHQCGTCGQPLPRITSAPPATLQGYTFAGRVNTGYTTPGAPMGWRDVYSCTTCGALVLANEKDGEAGTASNLVRHARWHKQTGTYERDDPGRPNGH